VAKLQHAKRDPQDMVTFSWSWWTLSYKCENKGDIQAMFNGWSGE